jgi:hypothetical protein
MGNENRFLIIIDKDAAFAAKNFLDTILDIEFLHIPGNHVGKGTSLRVPFQ